MAYSIEPTNETLSPVFFFSAFVIWVHTNQKHDWSNEWMNLLSSSIASEIVSHNTICRWTFEQTHVSFIFYHFPSKVHFQPNLNLSTVNTFDHAIPSVFKCNVSFADIYAHTQKKKTLSEVVMWGKHKGRKRTFGIFWYLFSTRNTLRSSLFQEVPWSWMWQRSWKIAIN